MKKYLEFNLDNRCCGVWDEPAADRFEFDYEPEKYFLPTLELRNGVVVHTLPNLTYSDQEKTFNANKEAEDFQNMKLTQIHLIKNEASRRIVELDWKLERAKEQDQLDGTTVRTQEILRQRQAIRDASNAHEAKLMAATKEEYQNFDPREF